GKGVAGGAGGRMPRWPPGGRGREVRLRGTPGILGILGGAGAGFFYGGLLLAPPLAAPGNVRLCLHRDRQVPVEGTH
ncbi:MAG: hypothetical protein ACRDU0_16685, partial [Mycobacterium sp.]